MKLACKPITVAPQNVDEGVGGNFQVKSPVKSKTAKMFLKVWGNYDPFLYGRGKGICE